LESIGDRAGGTVGARGAYSGASNGQASSPASKDRVARALEDRRLLERYHRDADPSAREALVERFLPLARQLVRR
jgi:RNA polymerase sigma-B factor